MIIRRTISRRRMQQIRTVGGREGRRPRRVWVCTLVVALGPLGSIAAGGALGATAPARAGVGCLLEPVGPVGDPGSVNNPYTVATGDDLIDISGCDGQGVHFRQTQHIDLTDTTFPAAVIPGEFRGWYDGGEFEIRGLTIHAPVGTTAPVGLFEDIGEGAHVRGVRLVAASVIARTSDVGALAGRALPGGTIIDVAVLPSEGAGAVASGILVIGEHDRVGGLVGTAFGASISSIRVANTFVTLRSTPGGTVGMSVGGVVGAAELSLLFDVEFSGTVTSDGDAVGGIAGTASGAELIGVSAAGSVSAQGDLVGGLVGSASAREDGEVGEEVSIPTSITQGYFDGVVSGRSVVGGAVGLLEDGELDLVSVGDAIVTAVRGEAGGIVGFGSDAQISQAAFFGTVSTTGEASDDPFATGGIAGGLVSSSVIGSSAIGSVLSTGEQTGGIVGLMVNGLIRDSAASVRIEGVAPHLGGIVGQLVAFDRGGTIACGLAVATVSRTWSAARDESGSTTFPLVGGITEVDCAGSDGSGQVSVTDSFWESDVPVLSIAGAPRTPAQMRSIATYTDTSDAALAVAWPIVLGLTPDEDAGSVWGMCPPGSEGYPYPFLLWQAAGLDEADICGDSAGGSSIVAPSGPTVTCAPMPARVGSDVTCTVVGGPAGGDILWRAAYNPTFAEAGVAIGADGTGTFTFSIPAAALGQPLSVELVDWAAPVMLGMVEGPVPASVPAGEGPAPHAPLMVNAVLLAVLLAVLVGAGSVARTVRDRRTMLR